MSTFTFTNGHVTIDGTDLSDHGHEVSVENNADAVDQTAFNSGGNRSFDGGLKSSTASISFRQDFATNKVDSVMNDIVGSTVAIALRAVNTTVSATNPEWQFNAVVTAYSPIGNSVGDGANAPVSLQITGAITRAVA